MVTDCVCSKCINTFSEMLRKTISEKLMMMKAQPEDNSAQIITGVRLDSSNKNKHKAGKYFSKFISY